MAKQRLQKVLAQAGHASRRGAEQLIEAGRVRVNGRVVREQGVTVDHRDVVELDGRRVVAQRPVYFLLHKPRRVVTTVNDPEGRQTVIDLLRGVDERVFPVGRLDYHTSGALLLTNDGALADALLRPKAGVPKVYVAKVPGDVDDDALAQLTEGVRLDDGRKTRPAEVVVLRQERGQTWLRLTLKEGRNRQVHRMLEAVGKTVHRLARLSFADLTTDGLRPGEFRPLKQKELERLFKRWGKGLELGPQDAAQDPEAFVSQVDAPRGRSQRGRGRAAKAKAGAASGRSSRRKSAAKAAGGESGGAKRSTHRSPAKKSSPKAATGRRNGSKTKVRKNRSSTS